MGELLRGKCGWMDGMLARRSWGIGVRCWRRMEGF